MKEVLRDQICLEQLRCPNGVFYEFPRCFRLYTVSHTIPDCTWSEWVTDSWQDVIGVYPDHVIASGSGGPV